MVQKSWWKKSFTLKCTDIFTAKPKITDNGSKKKKKQQHFFLIWKLPSALSIISAHNRKWRNTELIWVLWFKTVAAWKRTPLSSIFKTTLFSKICSLFLNCWSRRYSLCGLLPNGLDAILSVHSFLFRDEIFRIDHKFITKSNAKRTNFVPVTHTVTIQNSLITIQCKTHIILLKCCMMIVVSEWTKITITLNTECSEWRTVVVVVVVFIWWVTCLQYPLAVISG